MVQVPVAFFSLMCIPKHYIKPFVHPQVLGVQEFDIDAKWWAGASPYEGAHAYGTFQACAIWRQC